LAGIRRADFSEAMKKNGKNGVNKKKKRSRKKRRVAWLRKKKL
jgi:hypothetical protein